VTLILSSFIDWMQCNIVEFDWSFCTKCSDNDKRFCESVGRYLVYESLVTKTTMKTILFTKNCEFVFGM
jgi:hypothetical protein